MYDYGEGTYGYRNNINALLKESEEDCNEEVISFKVRGALQHPF